MDRKKTIVEEEIVITLNEDQIHHLVQDQLKHSEGLFFPKEGTGDYAEETKLAIAEEVVAQLQRGGPGIWFQKTPKPNQIAALTRIAERGNPQAQFRLGIIYVNGWGIRRDCALAGHWCEQAALQGHQDAQYCLGMMYFHGDRVPKDHKKAGHWWEQAALQGHQDAQYWLGLMYFNGDGVPEDHKKARYWWEQAAAQGDKHAKSRLRELNETSKHGLELFEEDRIDRVMTHNDVC